MQGNHADRAVACIELSDASPAQTRRLVHAAGLPGYRPREQRLPIENHIRDPSRESLQRTFQRSQVEKRRPPCALTMYTMTIAR